VYGFWAETRCPECRADCAEVPWGLCLLCLRVFCSRHLIVRKGVATCSGCLARRESLESGSSISTSDEERLVKLLGKDVVATRRHDLEDIIVEAAARIRLFANDLSDYHQRVVDDVQQSLHDSFIDTTWPRCPWHPNHPLWFSDGWWRCERAEKSVAPLGALPSTVK